MSQAKYQFGVEWTKERERLRTIEQWGDPSAICTLDEIGVAEGWHCLEVGAGGGSIAQWLCRRVGTAGRVVATDIDTRFLTALDYPNLEVLEHNVVSDELPEAAFDLVHVRGVLTHLPEREDALRKLVSALMPGGWLLMEETDSVTYGVDPSVPAPMRRLAEKADMYRVIEGMGIDVYSGSRMFALLRSSGLESVQSRGEVLVCQGGTPIMQFYKLTAERVGPAILASGHVTEREFEEFLALHDDPTFALRGLLLMHAWGRRPVSTN